MTKHYIDAQYKVLDKISGGIYITSLCGEHKEKDDYINQNGLLSQWRGYALDGGYAIEFEAEKLEEACRLEVSKYEYSHSRMCDLIYSDNDLATEELNEQVEHIFKFYIEASRIASSNSEELPDAEQSLPAFVNCITRYKHRGFKEENEVRIVKSPVLFTKEFLEAWKEENHVPTSEKTIRFREKNGIQIPYIELFDSQDIKLPIKRIIVGPHKDKNARAASLEVMLKKTDIKITVSDIPYIS
jgi:hypothetical protein